MKPVKITAELTLTPEMFKEWCCEDIPESERMYQHYVEKMLYSNFNGGEDIGDYKNFINTTIEDNGSGLKLRIEELEEEQENEEIDDPCPKCGKQLRIKWSGVDCSCGYWFCL